MTVKKTTPERGVSLRIDITADEYRALRMLAIERETTVPKMVAACVRDILAKAKKR